MFNQMFSSMRIVSINVIEMSIALTSTSSWQSRKLKNLRQEDVNGILKHWTGQFEHFGRG